jgi:hypothetical protein
MMNVSAAFTELKRRNISFLCWPHSFLIHFIFYKINCT